MKKVIVLILSIILVFPGCTSKLWNSKVAKRVSYDETIDVFMMNPKDKSLIFIGEKYHYIFEPNEKFVYLYDNKNENMFFDSNNGVYEIRDNKIYAYFSIYILTKNIKQEVIDWALNHNGKYIENNEKIKISITLEGKRYLSDPKVNQVVEKLSVKHNIKIDDIMNEDEYSIASKIALTPLTVTGDTIIVVGGVGGTVLLMGVFAAAIVTGCTLSGIFGKGCKAP